MPEEDGLDALSSQQLHDMAVRRAKRHLDVRFFYRLAQVLPAAEAGAGNLAESENDIYRLSGHINDVTESGKGETAEQLRPLYLEYLRKHHVTAESASG